MNIREILYDIQENLKKKGLDQNAVQFVQATLLCYAKNKLLTNSVEEYPSIFKKIHKIAEPYLTLLDNLNVIADKLQQNADECSAAYEELINKAEGGEGQRSDFYFQPAEITDLVYRLADYQRGTVYNPFAGAASYGLAFNAGNNYYGEDIDEKTWAFGAIRMIMKGDNAFSENYIVGDSLKQRTEQFDYVVSTPPFYTMREGRRIQPELNLLLYANSYLKDNGSLVIITTPRILWAQSVLERNTRKTITDENLIDSIILLPQRILPIVGISPVIIVLKKGRSEKDPIRLFDASKYFKKSGRLRNILSGNELYDDFIKGSGVLSVSNKQIAENNYWWDPIKYITETIGDDGLPKIKLEKISTVILMESVSLSEGKIIWPIHISPKPLETDIKDYKEIIEPTRCYKLTQSALLIPRILPLRVGYIKASDDNPVYISQNIIALSINDKEVYYKYLALELSKAKTPVYSGSILPAITREDLLNIAINYIPYKEQINTVNKEIQKEISIVANNVLSIDNKISQDQPVFYFSQKEKTYNVLACGHLDVECLNNYNLRIYTLSNVKDVVKSLEGTLKKKYDTVVCQFGNYSIFDIYRLLDKQLVTFWVTDDPNFDEKIPEDLKYLVANRIFVPGDEKNLALEIRKTLDELNSPESIIRNQYKEELDAAELIDDTFHFPDSLKDFLMKFLLSTINGDSSFEDSISNIRKFRDFLLEELKKINAVPALDPGAISQILLDRHYINKKNSKIQKNQPQPRYFIYKGIVPEPLACALLFITNVANRIIHNNPGIKDITYAAMHSLLAFVLWFKDRIEEKFFEHIKGDNVYWGEETHSPEEFVQSNEPQTVEVVKRGGKDYFYAGNVHLDGNRIRAGIKVMINSVKLENNPYLNDDGTRVYFYSTDWIEVR